MLHAPKIQVSPLYNSHFPVPKIPIVERFNCNYEAITGMNTINIHKPSPFDGVNREGYAWTLHKNTVRSTPKKLVHQNHLEDLQVFYMH